MITILIIAVIIGIAVFLWNKSNSARPDTNVLSIEKQLPIVDEQIVAEEIVEPVIETPVIEKPKRATTKKPATQKAPIKKTARKTKKD
jgi:hypothetical protein